MADFDWFIRANLKPRHFRMLVALDDFRNLARVADSMHVSQPAVSMALGELEKGLGLKLFDRTQKGVIPNAYGECLIRQARVVLTSMRQARDELHALQSGASGKISVGVLPAMTLILMPRALAALKERMPMTNVIVHEGAMETMLPDLRRGALDMVVGRLSNQVHARDLAEEPLFHGHIVVVTRRRHPLAKRRNLDWRDLLEYPWVVPPVESQSREPLENILQKHGIAIPANRIETVSVHVVTGYLMETDAVGFLSQGVARHYIKSGALTQLPLALPDPQRPNGITWIAHKQLSPAAKVFTACLREAAELLSL